MFKTFLALAHRNDDNTGRYSTRTMTSNTQCFSEISADVQKLLLNLINACVCSPTDATKQHLISMAVAYHMGKIYGLGYTKKEFVVIVRTNYKAWIVLVNQFKWSGNGDYESVMSPLPNETVCTHNVENMEIQNRDDNEAGNSERGHELPTNRRYSIGVKGTKLSI